MFSKRPASHSPSSPNHLSPLNLLFLSPSPSRTYSSSQPSSRSISPSQHLGYTPPGSRPVQSDEALRTVKVMEQVLVAWNEYRLAVAHQARTGRKSASAMKDLWDRTERDGVIFHALQPTATTFDGLANLTSTHAKRLDQGYDTANTEASRYFQNLAPQVRDHETFLANEGKRAIKSEKAYRKASKIMTDGAIHGSGLEGMKDALRLEVEVANINHANLIGDAQAAISFKLSAALAGTVSPHISYHSEALRISLERYHEIEHYRALAAAGWHYLSLPEPDATSANPTLSPWAAGETDTKAMPSSPRQNHDHVLPGFKAAAVPLRPKLPQPFASPMPEMARSRQSLPPPPMYASSASINTLSQQRTTTRLPDPPTSQADRHRLPSTPIPIPQARCRVSEITADLESLQVEARLSSTRPITTRAVSMPPQPMTSAAIGGPRPLGGRQPLPIRTTTIPAATGARSATPPQSIFASTSSSTVVPATPALSPRSALTAAVLITGAGKRRVSFHPGSQEESFPWDMGNATPGDDDAMRMKQPSPRRLPQFSPELRCLMSG